MLQLFALLAFFFALPMWITYRLAKEKHRNHRLWTISVLFFSWFSVILVTLLTKRSETIAY